MRPFYHPGKVSPKALSLWRPRFRDAHFSTFRTALLLPSVMRRIDDMLLVTELNAALFDHSIHEAQLHAAISAPSACAEFDYERLELLGDAYLKYLSSIYLFVTNPSQHEGALHSARLRIISNRALFLNAESVGLATYIQAKPLVPKQWCPPNFTVIPPPPPKAQENASATRVDKDNGAEREAGVDASETQEVIQEEKDCVSPDLSLRSGIGTSEPDAVETQECTTHRSFSAEPGPPQGDINRVPINDAGKPRPEKLSSSKKSKRDDQNVQWLGDKVNALQRPRSFILMYAGNRGRRGSDYRSGVYHRRERNGAQRVKSLMHRRAEH